MNSKVNSTSFHAAVLLQPIEILIVDFHRDGSERVVERATSLSVCLIEFVASPRDEAKLGITREGVLINLISDLCGGTRNSRSRNCQQKSESCVIKRGDKIMRFQGQ